MFTASTTTGEDSGLSALDLKSLLPKTVRNTINEWERQYEEPDGEQTGEYHFSLSHHESFIVFFIFDCLCKGPYIKL